MRNARLHHQQGFVLVELLIVIGIAAILYGLTSMSLLNIQHRTTISTAVESVIGDLKSQQLKAMAGKEKPSSTSSDSYGIHFDGTSTYILYHGTYSAGSSDNVSVTPDQAITFSATPANISFSQITGETGAADTITAQYISGSETKTILINKYGIVTSVN